MNRWQKGFSGDPWLDQQLNQDLDQLDQQLPSNPFASSQYAIQSYDLPFPTDTVSTDGQLILMGSVGINDAGLIAGYAYLHSQGQVARFTGSFNFTIQNGTITDSTNWAAADMNVLYKTIPSIVGQHVFGAGDYQIQSESASGQYGLVGMGGTVSYIVENDQLTPLVAPTVTSDGQPIDFYNPAAINDYGQMVGVLDIGSDISTASTPAGFFDDNGKVETFTVPGAYGTWATGINDAGEIVGYYETLINDGQTLQQHGFIDWDGQITTFGIDGAVNTQITGINDQGEIVGYYTDKVARSGYDIHNIAQYPSSGQFVFSATPVVNFLAYDTTTCEGVVSLPGTPYDGPVKGITNEFITTTPDNLNIAAQTPNVFISTGLGNDAIDVSAVNGNNVLDGGAGSNFLRGGTGDDVFFLNDISPTAPIWSTIANFHAGDMAVIWGITQDNVLTYLNNDGAIGFKGLTISVWGTGQPSTLTIAGYNESDLSNGRLTVAYGKTADIPGLPGSNYMSIVAN